MQPQRMPKPSPELDEVCIRHGAKAQKDAVMRDALTKLRIRGVCIIHGAMNNN